MANFKPKCHHHFYSFLSYFSWFTLAMQSDYLHSYGAATTANVARLNVLLCCPDYSKRIDAGMMVKAFVFETNEAFALFFGHTWVLWKSPLLVGSNLCPQYCTILVEKNHAYRVAKQIYRNTEYKPKNKTQAKRKSCKPDIT